MWKKRIIALIILALGFGVGYFVYKSEMKPAEGAPVGLAAKYPFRLGLDLSGGSHLVYQADVTKIDATEVSNSMSSLRDIIERRVNFLGVAEPIIQVEQSISGEQRLVVDLPGVTDVNKAIEVIGQTPLLEFKTENPNPPKTPTATVGKDGTINLDPTAGKYVSTQLTGRYLKKAILEFDQTTHEAQVALQFNDEGSKLFEEITKANVGKTVAIFLDGAPISTPVVREAITGGRAQISGNFTPTEAKTLVGRLNSGALPVPITLVSTQTIGATLGEKALAAGESATFYGFLIIAIFLILWYRLPGLIAVVALSLYVAIILALFKLIPVTLTAAGIAGFIISIGVAVDANVLIFERLKEEMRAGRTVGDAIEAGFSRAWFSIRDSNTSSIITALILFWFGTSLIKGFALTFGLGVIVSLFSAITVTRMILRAIPFGNGRAARFLFSSGFSK